MPARGVADLVLEMGSDEAQEFFDCIVNIVNLKGYTLHLTGVIGIEVLGPVFEDGKDIIDHRQLRSNICLED
jgi:hypothetical protein